MGALCSSETYMLDKETYKKQVEHNKMIEHDLEKDRKLKILKLLILGPGESGKSTTIKQIKIIHDTGYSTEEKMVRKHGIFMNILEGIEEIHLAVGRENMSYKNALSFDHIHEVRMFTDNFKKAEDAEKTLGAEVINAIQKYVKDETVAMMLKEKTVYNIDDSTIYFLEHFSRIIHKDYLPTEEDILKSRVPTSGVIQYKIMLKNFNFKIFDVGGQRAQRRKWLHVFDDVHAVLFITSLSEYDQVLREDATVVVIDSVIDVVIQHTMQKVGIQ
uniref:G-protein alpha subunit n=1 Tax=Caenorhabditis tropicalis TaxID=1561998 RepID=A0A1I7UVI6_9PELO